MAAFRSPSSDDGLISVLPAIRPVVFGMSNALEVFEFLQRDLKVNVQKRVEEERIR